MENFNFWIQAIISILSGIAVLVPLVKKLIDYVQLSTKEKNWNNMLKLLMNLMEEAENMFDKGADKKEWVMKELEAVAGTINFDIDWAVVSDMIDKICDTAHVIG